nr:hypothetical protein [Brucella intermedia]
MNFVAKFTGRALSEEEIRIVRSAYERQNIRETKKRIAAREKPRKLHDDLRTRLLETVIVILKEGRPTLFALEGTCRHHVRAFLCVEGWGWEEADIASADIVLTALNRIGAKRPSWADGQPEYRGHGFHGNMRRCINQKCHAPLEENQKLYCSDHCRHYVNVSRWMERNKEHALAQKVINRAKRKAADPEAFKAKQREYQRRQDEKRPVRECVLCSKPFKANKTQRYCSDACKYKRNEADKERACVVCFNRFFVRWVSEPKQTCSRKCAARLARYGPSKPLNSNNFKCEPVPVENNP